MWYLIAGGVACLAYCAVGALAYRMGWNRGRAALCREMASSRELGHRMLEELGRVHHARVELTELAGT
jgi:hypothetical protein